MAAIVLRILGEVIIQALLGLLMIPWWVYLLALGLVFLGAIWCERIRKKLSTPIWIVEAYRGDTGDPVADAINLSRNTIPEIMRNTETGERRRV